MAAAPLTDVLQFFCWINSCGERKRTAVVHDVECEAVGTDALTDVCGTNGLWDKLFKHKPLRSIYASKLTEAYEGGLGMTPAWCA